MEAAMVDQQNPTSQFHPYQPPDTIPVSEKPSHTGLSGMLSKLGIDASKFQNVDVRGSVDKARGYARTHPGKVLGGLALAVIGAGLLAKKRRSHI